MFGGFRSFIAGLEKSSTSPQPPSSPSSDQKDGKQHPTDNSTNTLLNPSLMTEQHHTTRMRRKSFSEMLHHLITEGDESITDENEESPKEINEDKFFLPPNNIGVEFTIGTVTLSNDLSFTQYFSASIFDTCLTFSVKRSDEQEELLGDDYKPTIAHSSRIRKSPLSDGFTFKWKGEKVILPIQLSDAEYQQVMAICNSSNNNTDGSHYVFEHSSLLESKKILPRIAMQLDNISTTSELLHSYIMKCKPHVNFIGESMYDINRLLDFRSRSVEMIELSLKRGKDKTGVITIGMKLILPQKPEIEQRVSSNNSVENLHDYETISFDDSFILSGLRRKPSSEKLTSICDSNFDIPQNNSENIYEETHYELLEEVGRGSFGKVYKAIRKSDKALVGIKKINCDNINNANDALVEFWPIRKISYPQLISIQDIYFSKTNNEYSSLFTLCLVMEYMENGDLEQFIIGHKEQGQSIQEPHLLSLMIQMAAGLNHLHLNGLLHRDIKGKNILLGSKFKECKIGDFGLIYNLRSLTSKNLNDTISSAGTIKYQSPECHIGVKDITELDSTKQTTRPTSLFMNYIYSSDIWSMGVVFLELVGCEILNFSPYVIAMKDQQQFHEFIRTRCSKYHQGFANLIISMLSLEPKDRPDSEKLVRTLLNLKKELFGQQRSVKIHPVIEIHRQLLSVGKSVKGMFLGSTNNNTQQDEPVSNGGLEKSSKRTLSLHSVKDFFSNIHKVVDEDTPTPEETQNTSSTHSLNRDVFSFGLW